MPDLEEIKEQMGPLGFKHNLIMDLVKELPAVMDEGEIIKKWVFGDAKGILGGNGLIVATNERLIFLAHKLVGKRIEIFPYKEIRSIRFKKGILRGEITVSLSDGQYLLTNVFNEFGMKFCQYVMSANINVKQVMASKDFEAPINALSHSDEDVRTNALRVLEKLGEESVERLIEAAIHLDSDVRLGAAEALGTLDKYAVVIIRGGLIKYVNNRLPRINGFSRGELEEKLFINFVSPKFRELLLDRYKRRIAGEKIVSTYEAEILSKDGRSIPVEISAYLVEYEGRPADLALIREIPKKSKKSLKVAQ